MKIVKSKTALDLGKAAAKLAAEKINEAISKNGSARIILSTGASQFETIDALIAENVDWSKVEMFHLDEYVNLPDTHPASFRKYLRERFASKIPLKCAHYVDGNHPEESIAKLTEEIKKAPVDVALIGIGENAHIAFNDPPADFDTRESYRVVNLDDKCRDQQVGEGWFATRNDVPAQAISMTPYQIMESKVIISCVPHAVKANAIKMMLESDVTTNLIPATLLKEHKDYYLYIDENSGAYVK